MAAASYEVFTHPVIATAALTAARAVTAAGALPAAAGRCLGFAKFGGAVGERVNVAVIGSTVAEAGGAFALGAALELDATGRVVTLAAGVKVACALAAAAAAGDKIEVVLIPN